MTKNPLLNALAATAYIAIVASVMFYGPGHDGHTPTVLIPIAVLSLFTLSAVAMAYIFFYQPFQLYVSNNKKQALMLFGQTIAIFAVITAIIFTLFFVIQ